MNSIVCSQIKAIGLFVTLFVCATSEDEIYFSTKPKDKEVFLEEDVQFDWDYVVEDVTAVQFGVVIEDPVTKGSQNIAIYVKTKNENKQNNLNKEIEWIRNRVDIVPNKRASFKIRNVKMEDSVTFFCQIVYGTHEKTASDQVKLSVVDLLIDKLASTKAAESWVSHKISVVCAVKVPESSSNAKFSWMHIPSNRTVSREYHDDMRSKSYLRIVTKEDKDFETLQCKAETKETVKFHTINITKLSPPSQPRNLKTETVFDKKSAVTYIRLNWDPPLKNGGSGIDKYIIQYIASGLPWKSPNVAETKNTKYDELKLPNGRYNARVRAQNKAGRGPPSNEVLINLEDVEQSFSKGISGSSQINRPVVFLLLLSVVAWFL